MAQKAILKFVQADKTTASKIRITQGEMLPPEWGNSHVGIYANDFGGISGSSDCYLLAPFDCMVKAIRKTGNNGDPDNTVFFESIWPVQTAKFGIQNKVSFTCTHMDTSDLNELGIAVGNVYHQGDIIYKEGRAGLGADGARHIHMLQALGGFNGPDTLSPSRVLDGVKWYNLEGKAKDVYIINAAEQVPVYNVFYAGCEVVKDSQSPTASNYVWSQVDGTSILPPEEDDDDQTNSPATNHIQTMLLTCTKASMSSGYYPTRPGLNEGYHATDFLIAPGDMLKIQDIKVASDGNIVCHIKYSFIFNRIEDLSGRWVVYDKLNFE